uniref:RING finger protein 141 n=1 Tax=Parascaris univalens TaxID=6257 RepID=A0A915C2X3_PARUN
MLRKELLVMNASRLCLQVEMMLKFARIIRKFNKGFNKEIRGSRCDVDMDGERVGRCVCRCDAHRSAKTDSCFEINKAIKCGPYYTNANVLISGSEIMRQSNQSIAGTVCGSLAVPPTSAALLTNISYGPCACEIKFIVTLYFQMCHSFRSPILLMAY